MSNFWRDRPFVENALFVWFFSVSIFSLLGNAASDVWISVSCLIFLLYCVVNGDWSWLLTRWFQVALVFWGWSMCASALSNWPLNSLEASAVWIRFPLFAIGFVVLTERFPDIRRWFLWGMAAALVVMAAVLVFEKLSNPEQVRLYGTWGQSTKAGWLTMGFGFPLCAWLFMKARTAPHYTSGAFALSALVLLITALTGEIYMTLSLSLGLVLLIVMLVVRVKNLFLVVPAFFVGLLLFFWSAPSLGTRFLQAFTERLPWLPTSDYYAPWMRGVKTMELNWLTGIGPRNHLLNCEADGLVQNISQADCFNHPHQLYLQIGAETGLFGLALFLLLIGFLLHIAYKTLSDGDEKRSASGRASLCLLITIFWPISAYSNAFGQHRNFFTWVIVAWALSLVLNASKERRKVSD